jgi:hypothetical protein
MKNMKNRIVRILKISTISVIMFILNISTVSAQVHEFSVYGAGGLSSLRYQLSMGNASGGFGGDFGVGYTYFQKINRVRTTGSIRHKFWAVHSGVGLGVYNAKAKLDKKETIITDLSDGDEVYDRFNLHSTFSGYKETQNTLFLNIPLMALFQYDMFYGMGGLKFGIPLSGKYKSKNATITNKAYYPELDNWVETQEFRGIGVFTGQSFNGNLDLGVSVMLALEGGLRLNLSRDFTFYAGLFFDYGLNNIAKKETTHRDFLNYNPENPANFTANSVLSSFADKANLISVGIKLRVGWVSN